MRTSSLSGVTLETLKPRAFELWRAFELDHRREDRDQNERGIERARRGLEHERRQEESKRTRRTHHDPTFNDPGNFSVQQAWNGG